MTSPFRTAAFRAVAGILTLGIFAVACMLLYWGATGDVAWERLLPSVLLQLMVGYTFGRFALGKPGPHNRQPKG